MTEWIELNRRNWDERATPHAASPGYSVDRFETDPTFLSKVVQYDVDRLGPLAGLRGIHLQCHIGTDTISLSRLGATMTGVDFAPRAIATARSIAARASADVQFVQSDVDSARAVVSGDFDFVFTGIGALCWLPSITRWASVVASLLRPSGRLHLREGHPMLWASEVDDAGQLGLRYPYFERAEPTVWDEPGTYVPTDHVFENTASAEWNHGLGEIVTALLGVGMELTMLVEHDTVPWQPFPGWMDEVGDKEWQLRDRPWRLPHSYTLQAVKR